MRLIERHDGALARGDGPGEEFRQTHHLLGGVSMTGRAGGANRSFAAESGVLVRHLIGLFRRHLVVTVDTLLPAADGGDRHARFRVNRLRLAVHGLSALALLVDFEVDYRLGQARLRGAMPAVETGRPRALEARVDHALVDVASILLDEGGRVLLERVVVADELADIAVDGEVPVIRAISRHI